VTPFQEAAEPGPRRSGRADARPRFISVRLPARPRASVSGGGRRRLLPPTNALLQKRPLPLRTITLAGEFRLAAVPRRRPPWSTHRDHGLPLARPQPSSCHRMRDPHPGPGRPWIPSVRSNVLMSRGKPPIPGHGLYVGDKTPLLGLISPIFADLSRPAAPDHPGRKRTRFSSTTPSASRDKPPPPTCRGSPSTSPLGCRHVFQTLLSDPRRSGAALDRAGQLLSAASRRAQKRRRRIAGETLIRHIGSFTWHSQSLPPGPPGYARTTRRHLPTGAGWSWPVVAIAQLMVVLDATIVQHRAAIGAAFAGVRQQLTGSGW